MIEFLPDKLEKPINWNQGTIDWMWRLAALLFWLAILAAYPSVSPFKVSVHSIYLFVTAGILVGTGSILRLRKDSGRVLMPLVGFPFYTLFFPLFFPLVLINEGWIATQRAAHSSQRFFGSILPYIISIGGAVLLDRTNFTRTGWLVVVLIATNLYLVFVSLVMWIFKPLPWGEKGLGWFFAWELKRAL